MRHSWLVFFLLFAAAPAHAVYEPVAPQQPQQQMPPQSPQDVEEPDSPDDDTMAPPQQPEPETPVIAPAVPLKPAVASPPAQAEGDAGYDKVVLQGLNKVTARAEEIQAPLGSVVRFGTVEIIAHRCWKSAPEERPENAALLEISEIKQGEAPQRIFLGWMFSSSPALSALEHPFYDITVVRCEKEAVEAPAPVKELPKKGKR